MVRAVVFAAAGLLGAAVRAAAQVPVEGPSELVIRADTQSLEGSRWSYRGFADLRFGDLRIQADRLDLYRETSPEGTLKQRIVAEGNVVFLRGEERLAGERLEMDLDKGQGVFEQAVGFVSPGVFLEARRIERVDANTYRIEGGRFTSCSQPTPRWSFSAHSATLDVGERISATAVTFKVKQVPAFFIPYFTYPIQEDQRSSGLLFPHFGYSSARGFNIGTGFFLTMGRSADQTLYADHYSDFGYGLGHELRYVRTGTTRGTFRTYALKPRKGGPWDYDLDWNAVQNLPGGARATLQVRQYSDLAFQQQIQDSLDYASRRTRRSALNVQKTTGNTTLQALAQSLETFFPGRSRVNRQLPMLRAAGSPRRYARSGLVVSYEARAESVGFGDPEDVQSFWRFDANPRLSRPFSKTFLQVTPEVQVRYTRYGSSYEERGGGPLEGGPLDRRTFEGTVQVRGPNFSKVFDNPFGFYTDKFKHVIGPEVTWVYRSRVEDFDFIPKFDSHDYLLGTNQVDYALVNRLYARRPPSPGAKPTAYEFLTWTVRQSYYVQIGASEFDRNFSSAAFGPGGVPDHNSPLLSSLRLRPAPGSNLDFNVEYDVNFKQLRSLGLSGTVRAGGSNVSVGWSRANRVAARAERRTRTRDTLRGTGRVQVLPGRLAVEGSADYDILAKKMLQSAGRVRYDIQCCGLMVEVIDTGFNAKQDRQFRFAIELANIGSIGNFMGQDADARRQGLGGFR